MQGRGRDRLDMMAAVYDQRRGSKPRATPKARTPKAVGLHYTQVVKTPHRPGKKHSFSPVNRQHSPSQLKQTTHLPLLKTAHRTQRLTPRNLNSSTIHRRTQSQPDHKQRPLSYAVKTLKGHLPGTSKANQDSSFSYPCVGGHPQVHAFGICDGHGQFGLEISKFVAQTLPLVLEKDPELMSDPEKAITASVISVDYHLNQSGIDINFSGTTAVLALIHRQTVICGNVGDSRAFIGRKTASEWQIVPLSRDHKPSEPDEASRIHDWNGRIAPYYDKENRPLGPLRVWLADEDIPGLAMSRSLGDHVAAMAGVSSQAEIKKLALEEADKVLVLGSDGLFEFLSNEELLALVVPFVEGNNPKAAAEKLVQAAEARWRTVSVYVGRRSEGRHNLHRGLPPLVANLLVVNLVYSLASFNLLAGVVVFSAGVNNQSVVHEYEAVGLDFVRMSDDFLLLCSGQYGQRVDGFPGVRGVRHAEGDEEVVASQQGISEVMSLNESQVRDRVFPDREK